MLGSWFRPLGSRIRTFALMATVCVAVVLGVSSSLVVVRVQAGLPKPVGIQDQWRDPEFPSVDPVSGTPDDWITAVCTPHMRQNSFSPGTYSATEIVYLTANTMFELPGSTYSALCEARVKSASDPVLLVAQYPAEDLMEHDLARNGFRWYCFAVHRGQLSVIATRAENAYSGMHGLAVSPVLEPLTSYGFTVFGDPKS